MKYMEYEDGKRVFLDHFENETDATKENMEKYPLELWAGYKLCKSDIDIDVSEWAIKNYIRKYSFLKNGEYRNQKSSKLKFEIVSREEIYRGDTMTSFVNFIRSYYIRNEGLRNIGGESCAKKIVADNDKENFDEDISRLSHLCHSEGNLIPVPLYFNYERSGSFADCDFWDLVMHAVYHWCKKKNVYCVEKLLNRYGGNKNIAESVRHFKNWMNNFNNCWDRFIEENYLRAFVDCNGNPVEFWTDHFFGNRKLQKLTDYEFRCAINRISECIESRISDMNK